MTTLLAAWQAFGWSQDNLTFVERFVGGLGIMEFEGKATYIKAIRPGVSALAIFVGSTVGFLGEDEARVAAQGLTHYGRDLGAKADRWWVLHPHRRSASMRIASAARRGYFDFGDCPNHFVKLPATGVCDLCGYDALAQ